MHFFYCIIRDKANISDIIENLSYQNDIGKDDLENILINAL